MIPGRIEGATRYLGAPEGWEPETSGECGHLAIRDQTNFDHPSMVSAWLPTPAEIAAIVAGSSIHLSIIGNMHPPVLLFVGPVPE